MNIGNYNSTHVDSVVPNKISSKLRGYTLIIGLDVTVNTFFKYPVFTENYRANHPPRQHLSVFT